jgi:hypothetical protein
MVLLNLSKLLLLLAAVGVTCYSVNWGWSAPIDFPQYYEVGRLYLSGDAASIYDPAKLSALEHQDFPKMPVRHQSFPHLPADPAAFWYPPYAIPVFAWLGLMPPIVAMWVWSGLNLVALAGALSLLSMALIVPAGVVVMLWSLVAISGPYAQALILGQPTFIILFGLSLAVYAFKTDKHWLLAALGLCLMVPKPTIALPLFAYLFGAGKYKPVFTAGAFGVVLLILSFTTMPHDIYPKYLELMGYAAKHTEVHALNGHLTLNGQLTRLLVEPPAIVGKLMYGLYAIVLLAITWLGRRFRQTPRWLEIGLMGALPLGLLVSPYCHPYDILTIIPGVLVYITAKSALKPFIRWERPLLLATFIYLFAFFFYSPIYFWKIPINLHFLWYLCLVAVLTGQMVKNRNNAAFTGAD